MSSFHAVFSGGALLGAALGGLCAAQGVSQPRQYLVTALVSAGALALSTSSMVCDDELVGVASSTTASTGSGGANGAPRRNARLKRHTVLVFGTIAFAGMLSEGAAADWSGVHLRDTLGWTEGAAARGFIAFQICMTLGRVLGDRVVAALGARRTLLTSAMLSAVGFGGGLISRSGWPFVVGVALLGLGLAVIVPVVFSAAAAEAGHAGTAIARVSTIGYAGFLVGPPVIGQVAQWTSTTIALGFVPVLAVAVVVITTLFVHPAGASTQ
jgi:fucose permease